MERRAEELSVEGLTTKEVAGRLSDEYGLSRNRAYEVALRATSGK